MAGCWAAWTEQKMAGKTAEKKVECWAGLMVDCSVEMRVEMMVG